MNLTRSWDRKGGRQVSLVLADRCCGVQKGPLQRCPALCVHLL